MWGKKKSQNNGGWDTQSIRNVFFDTWLIKLEKKAFGWQLNGTSELEYGSEVNYTYMENTDTVYRTETPLREHYTDFIRRKGYCKNPLFKLAEFFYGIFLHLRRFFLSLILVLFVPLLALSFILSITQCEFGSILPFAFFEKFLSPIGSVCAILIGVPLILTLIAFALRKLLKLDNK